MTRDGRLLLFVTFLMMYGLLAVESSRYREDDTSVEVRQHRHRHRHEAWKNSRNHREPSDSRKSSWSQNLEYEYEDVDDENNGDDDDNDNDNESNSKLEEYEDDADDEDYEVEGAYRHERPYPRSHRNGYHERIFEWRHPSRNHRNGYHHSWYEQEKEKRRPSSRYNWRYHRSRADRFNRNYRRRRGGHSRNRDSALAFREENSQEYEEELDYERLRGRHEDVILPTSDRHSSSSSSSSSSPSASSSSRRSAKKHRSNWRRDWRNKDEANGYKNGRRTNHSGDFDVAKRFKPHEDRTVKENSTKSEEKKLLDDSRKDESLADYEELLESLEGKASEKGEHGILKEGANDDEDDEEDEDEDGNDADDEADEEDEDEEDELDNDFYKNEKKAKKSPLNTFDDIIRRLTSDDPITARPTVKRDYRNIGEEYYPRRIINHGNSKLHENVSRVSRDHSRVLVRPSSPYVSTGYLVNKKKQPSEDAATKVASESTTIERKKEPSKSVISAVDKSDEHSGKAAFKIEDTRAKTKSLEQDYDEYLNTDNEKEEDLIKAGVDEDSGMQADVTNMDYGEDESTDTQETSASTFTVTTSTTSTTSTTTTSTPRPVVTQHFDYRDPRAYEGSTGSQYNGYQAKNEYPPMSAHSVHKWQSLGTRESVKETRSNMQQYNKNGKNAEIKEAIQHAIKVSREGSCQWPRPRVIPVRDVYPSPSVTYIPHCAILHRCSDDTGCCRSEALTCVPKHSHRVELSFYTTNIGGSSVVEKLSFYNHTECECKEKTEYEATTEERPFEQRFYRHYQSPSQPQNMRRGPPKKSCRCPSEFTPRITPDGECQCNCYEHNQNCIKTRRGKGYFSLSDRLCIQNNQCATPNCEFGEYMKREGKCPRKRDKFDAIANFRTNLNHRYRS